MKHRPQLRVVLYHSSANKAGNIAIMTTIKSRQPAKIIDDYKMSFISTANTNVAENTPIILECSNTGEIDTDTTNIELNEIEFVDDAIKLYLRDIQRIPLLTPESEKELAHLVATGDQQARNKMIESNLRLVVKVAKRYANRGLQLLDLIEEGNIGLMRAVERFDLGKECRFSTYAIWWIRQSVERAVINQSRTIRLPVHVADEISLMFKTMRKLSNDLQREPTRDELAVKMDVSTTHINDLLNHLRPASSTETALGDNEDFTLNDIIEDTSSPSPATLHENINSYNHLTDCFHLLNDTEKKVLILRFGLEDNEAQTLEIIGKELGVTRERIRQIEAKALQKLKKAHQKSNERKKT